MMKYKDKEEKVGVKVDHFRAQNMRVIFSDNVFYCKLFHI